MNTNEIRSGLSDQALRLIALQAVDLLEVGDAASARSLFEGLLVFAPDSDALREGLAAALAELGRGSPQATDSPCLQLPRIASCGRGN